jgi:MFS family permease
VWLLKPLFGFISDSFAVFGTKRKFYLIFFSVSQGLTWFWLSKWVTGFYMAVFAQVLINISTGFINVIGEALIVEMSKLDEAQTSNNVASYLSLTAVSMLFSSYLGGFLLDYMSVRQIFQISAIFPIVTLISGLFVKEKT